MRLRRASHFLSLAREKVTKERGTPLGAFRAFMPGKYVSRWRAFRRHIRVPAKRHRPPVDARFAACRPRLTAAQGTRQSREPSRLALGAQPRSGCKGKAKDNGALLIWLFEECAQDARCSTRGPLCGGEAWPPGPQGNRHDADSFSSAHGRAVEKPGHTARTFRAGCPESAKRGGLSLGYFSLAKQRKVTRAPKAHESSCLKSAAGARNLLLPDARPNRPERPQEHRE